MFLRFRRSIRPQLTTRKILATCNGVICAHCLVHIGRIEALLGVGIESGIRVR